MNVQGLNLTVAAKPENLAVIRHALAGYAEAMGFDSDSIADLKTIVTEACMNVVVHAYPSGAPGPLEVRAEPHENGVEVAVRDHGAGFRPRPVESEEAGLRLGLPLIATLADEFEVRVGVGGTEVRMVQRLGQNGNESGGSEETAELDVAPGTVLSIAAGTFVRPVLARVIGALAARADFSVDRLSDAVLLGDAVSAHDAQAFYEGTVGIEIVDDDNRLDMRVGPLVDGAGQRMLESLELPGGASLSKLASEVEVRRERAATTGETAEFLVLGIDR